MKPHSSREQPFAQWYDAVEVDTRIAEAIDYLSQQLCDIEHAYILAGVTKILEGK